MYRVGFGLDAHRFAKGRKLILGGAEIPFKYGLKGHSDADVLSHAICDALFGALGEGDIGSHFPNSDHRYEGASSLEFIKEALEFLAQRSYKVENIDSVIVCEQPKISPFIPEIKSKLASLEGLSDKQLGVKATTTDKMGFVGRGEGISAYSIALIRLDSED